MGRVGPTTASSLEILTIQYFPNQTSIYTSTAAYATHRYGTSPHQEYLLEFTSEDGISEALHPELPGPEERIVDFPEGKVGVYTKFFEFANFRLPLSQFLFDILGYYQIHLSQLSVIGVAKVSHFEINCRVLNIVPTLSLFRVFYIPSFNSGWMSFNKRPRKNTPQCYTKPLDSLKKLEQLLLLGGREGILDYYGLAHKCSEGWDASREYLFARGCDDTEHTSHPNPETTRSTTLLSRVEPQILPGRRDMDLFSLIRAPNPTKMKTGTRPRVAHKVPLLTVNASRVIEMEDPAVATDSSRVPSSIERSPLDFVNENPSQQSTGPEDQGQEAVAPKVPPPENVTTTGVAPEAAQEEGIAALGPYVVKERHKRGNDGVDTNAPPKVLRRDHADSRPTESTREGKSLAAIELEMGSTYPVPASQGAPVDVSDPDPLYFADPQSHLLRERPRPEIRNQRIPLLPPWSGHPKAFIGQNRARKNEIKNLETLLEAETDMKKAAEGRSAELSKELENLRALFLDLQVSNNHLSQQVSTLQAHVMGEEKLKAAFEEFKQYEDNRVEQRLMKCDESTELRQAFADVVSARIAKGMSEGLNHGVEHEKANLSLEAIEAYDLEAEAKYIVALHALKDLKYPIVDQLESLKDAPMDVKMASLHLESDTGDDAPQWIRELRPSSSQLTIPVYPKARDPTDPWACKEDILVADAIAANVSRGEKKKNCRVVCRTHGVGSAHHPRSDGVPVSVPTVAPQGLAILLADAATQTEISEDGASPRLLRSCSLPVMHN
nr:hypothetical protein [Tanacetum cinerariifolium]